MEEVTGKQVEKEERVIGDYASRYSFLNEINEHVANSVPQKITRYAIHDPDVLLSTNAKLTLRPLRPFNESRATTTDHLLIKKYDFHLELGLFEVKEFGAEASNYYGQSTTARHTEITYGGIARWP
ncbi:hypothetical protein M406DRAFT_328167 [Cryphonectria parasitica EP155]|uniref:Uncharacterized protein n=1 Tax=Cryphonectria parasitica (strain ATCC 38755 / EP155) TaxID=660469 RepID=A0A9P5CRG0_CRYP1|nr:uncharacterized protein M406DRAFT_328167 [Cryphonectria parasitica EP155]KAF3767060.1 hypothetical protein M406DRAFT_328167 [Cryphonectria parasitica EP155]